MDVLDPLADYAPPEVAWRLVIDRAWVEGKVVKLAEPAAVDGWFALRLGRFVGLAEGAE